MGKREGVGGGPGQESIDRRRSNHHQRLLPSFVLPLTSDCLAEKGPLLDIFLDMKKCTNGNHVKGDFKHVAR